MKFGGYHGYTELQAHLLSLHFSVVFLSSSKDMFTGLREEGRERNIHWLLAVCALTTTQVYALAENRTRDLLVRGTALQTTATRARADVAFLRITARPSPAQSASP